MLVLLLQAAVLPTGSVGPQPTGWYGHLAVGTAGTAGTARLTARRAGVFIDSIFTIHSNFNSNIGTIIIFNDSGSNTINHSKFTIFSSKISIIFNTNHINISKINIVTNNIVTNIIINNIDVIIDINNNNRVIITNNFNIIINDIINNRNIIITKINNNTAATQQRPHLQVLRTCRCRWYLQLRCRWWW